MKTLKDTLSDADLSKTDRLLLVLLADNAKPRSVGAIKNLNVSSLLDRTKGLAVRTKEGWQLTERGRAHVANILGTSTSPVKAASQALFDQLPAISDSDARKFTEEAVGCLEAGFYRAAVVLSWVGAMAVMRDHVLSLP